MKNLSAKEQKQLREKAKKELVRLESIDTDTIQLLDKFKNKFNYCETIYKMVLKEHQRSKGKDPQDENLKLNMNQVPSALKFAGYTFDKDLLTEIFGSARPNSSKGKTVKKLRDRITHGISRNAIEEITNRQIELFGYMDTFLDIIRTFDDIAT